jgi:glucuronoarabinoxylan endo-1,4-beta-xylanase
MALAVDATTTFQTMAGFGAADAFAYSGGYSTAVADFLWSQSKGIGLSIMRSRLWVDVSTSQGWPGYFTPMDSTGVELEGNFSVELQAYSRGVRTLFVTCWAPQLNPPYSWLSGGSQNGSLLLSEYAAMANAFTTYLSNALTDGVYVTHISIMNEPDFTPTYPQTSWTPTEAVNFVVNNLGPALATWAAANPSWGATTGMSVPGIIFGEVDNWNNLATWVSAVEGNPTAVGYVTQYASHQYNGVVAPPSPISHPIWETEYVDGNAYDTTMTEGIYLANSYYTAITTGNAAAWMWWLAEDVSDNNNSGVVGTNGSNFSNPPASLADWNAPTFPKKAYCLGNIAKFVRPGAVRINATGAPGGVNVLAFLNEGNVVIVCINTNASSTAINVTLNGIGATTVTAWITDATRNLVAQPAVAGGSSFSATLAATSVTTFVGANGSSPYYAGD